MRNVEPLIRSATHETPNILEWAWASPCAQGEKRTAANGPKKWSSPCPCCSGSGIFGALRNKEGSWVTVCWFFPWIKWWQTDFKIDKLYLLNNQCTKQTPHLLNPLSILLSQLRLANKNRSIHFNTCLVWECLRPSSTNMTGLDPKQFQQDFCCVNSLKSKTSANIFL